MRISWEAVTSRVLKPRPVRSVGVLIASLKSVVAQTPVACARSGRAKALGRKRAAYWRALGFPNVAKPER